LGIVRSGEARRFKRVIRSAFDKTITECRSTIVAPAVVQAIEQFRERSNPGEKKALHALTGMERERRGCET
jgi:hypothetical protein